MVKGPNEDVFVATKSCANRTELDQGQDGQNQRLKKSEIIQKFCSEDC